MFNCSPVPTTKPWRGYKVCETKRKSPTPGQGTRACLDFRRSSPSPRERRAGGGSGSTDVELRVLMKIISFLNVHCKYTVYAKWGCEPFWKAFPPISRPLSKRCAANCMMLNSSLDTECVRKISPDSGN